MRPSVRSFPAYGARSNRNVDDLEGGPRQLRADGQGLEGRKRDELDFARRMHVGDAAGLAHAGGYGVAVGVADAARFGDGGRFHELAADRDDRDARKPASSP